MQRHGLILPSLTAACFAALAPGGPGAFWVEIDNSVNPANGNPTGLDDGSYDGTVYRTFDLYAVLQAPWFSNDPQENGVYAVDFGIAGPNTGLVTDGVFFQAPAPFDSDSVIVNESLAPFQDQVFYDSAVAMADEPITFIIPMVWDPSGVTGAFFPQLVNQIYPSEGAFFYIARITLSADASELGGQCFVSDDQCEPMPFGGCDHIPAVYIHTIPNAFLELECLGDINWDGVVDTADLGRLIRSFGSGWGDADFNPRADFTRDGVVDTADLGRLIQNFGQTCE